MQIERGCCAGRVGEETETETEMEMETAAKYVVDRSGRE
jgi:hypothetical protein